MEFRKVFAVGSINFGFRIEVPFPAGEADILMSIREFELDAVDDNGAIALVVHPLDFFTDIKGFQFDRAYLSKGDVGWKAFNTTTVFPIFDRQTFDFTAAIGALEVDKIPRASRYLLDT